MESRSYLRFIQVAVGVLALLALVTSIHLARAILIPFVLSVILTFVLMPIVIFLKNRKVPGAIAALLSLGVAMAFVFVVGYLVWISLHTMNESIPLYSLKLREGLHILDGFLSKYDINLNSYWPEVQKQATVLVGKTANLLM